MGRCTRCTSGSSLPLSFRETRPPRPTDLQSSRPPGEEEGAGSLHPPAREGGTSGTSSRGGRVAPLRRPAGGGGGMSALGARLRAAAGATAAEAAQVLWGAAQVVAGVVVVHNHVGQVCLCVGPSMWPTLNPRGDVLLVEKPSVAWLRIRPGDVVIAASPTNPRQTVCKRVAGLEGDRVRYWQGGLRHTAEVPKGHVFLMGDNRANSTDSRHYGPVPYALLTGRAVLKLWPWDEAGPLGDGTAAGDRGRRRRSGGRSGGWW